MTVPPQQSTSADELLAYRLTEMEKDNKELNAKVAGIQADVSALKDSITSEFAALRKTLFERPLFVTFELLKVELESRDRALDTLQTSKDNDIKELKSTIEKITSNTVSTGRHYTTVAIAVGGVFIAPFISDFLRRLS